MDNLVGLMVDVIWVIGRMVSKMVKVYTGISKEWRGKVYGVMLRKLNG